MDRYQTVTSSEIAPVAGAAIGAALRQPHPQGLDPGHPGHAQAAQDAAASVAPVRRAATGEGEDAHEALAFLGQRYSMGPKYLGFPAPSPQELRRAVAIALRAPDHQQLRPFRFVRVGDAQRERLAGLFAHDAARRGHCATEVERARQRAYNGPALLAVLGRVRPNVEDVPEHEQWACIGAGMMNLLNALHLMGYGAKILSGASVRDPDIQAAFCRTGETLVSWILAGTPTCAARPKQPDDVQAALSDWIESEPQAPGEHT
ncbi:MAG: nitroreductase family protein [Ramlibacter sp.]